VRRCTSAFVWQLQTKARIDRGGIAIGKEKRLLLLRDRHRNSRAHPRAPVLATHDQTMIADHDRKRFGGWLSDQSSRSFLLLAPHHISRRRLQSVSMPNKSALIRNSVPRIHRGLSEDF
jgi:hypothetical protein